MIENRLDETIRTITGNPQPSQDASIRWVASHELGDKTARIDPPLEGNAMSPHMPILDQASTQISVSWDAGVGTVEMGIGNVVANNDALQQAAVREVAAPRPQVSSRVLKIQPAWEVDYFRWPRLTRRLLQTHQSLFDQIGGQLLNDLQPTQSRIGVCSTFPREGKTTIATCLARWAALSGKRTLLIDADIERPRMTRMCGLNCPFGWQSLLDTDLPASEAMIRSVESGLIFMPCRVDTPPMIVNKSIQQLGVVTFQMKYEFDVVVIDMGTIDNICAHGSQQMDIVDAMVVTRDPSRASVGQMMDTRGVLENLGIARTYVAQNFARPTISH